MELIHAFARVTHKYVDEWRHLDDERYVGVFKATPARIVDYGNDYDDGPTYLRHVWLPRGTDTKEAAMAVRDTLTNAGCSHEYDCCGCASYHTTVTIIGKRRLLARTRVTRNF